MEPRQSRLAIRLQRSSGAVREETLDGRRYLVAPVVAALAGVMNEAFFPPEVWADSIASWENTPLTLNHPSDQRQDEPIDEWLFRANQEMERQRIGLFRNVYLTSDHRPAGEVWIDLSSEQSREVAEDIRAGDRIDVSTGVVGIHVAESGNVNGRSYSHRYLEILPHHLAVLPDQRGACAVDDGCGINQTANVLRQARRPRFRGTESVRWSRPSLEDFLRARGQNEPANVAELSSETKQWIANHTLAGDPNATDFRNLSMFPVVNPASGRLNRQALLGVLTRAPNTNIPLQARRSAASVARTLFESNFGQTNNQSSNTAAANPPSFHGSQPHLGGVPGADAAQLSVAMHVDIPIRGDLSQRIRAVSEAVREKFRTDNRNDPNDLEGFVIVESVANDFALYMQRLEGRDQHFRVNYSIIDENGGSTVTLGDPERVEIELRSAESKSKWSAFVNGVREFLGGRKMDRTQKIQALKQARNLSEKDVQSIEQLSDETIDKLYEGVAQSSADDDRIRQTTAQNAEAAERKELSAKILAVSQDFSEERLGQMSLCDLRAVAKLVPAANADRTPSTSSQSIDTKQLAREFVEAVPGLKDVLASHANEQKRAEEKKGKLVQSIAASKKNTLAKEQLEAMTIEQLEGIDSMIAPANYSGAAGPVPQISEDRKKETYRGALDMYRGQSGPNHETKPN